MQREIGDAIHLGETVSPFDNVGRSSATDRTASNYNDTLKVKKKNQGAHTNWRISR